MTDVAREAGCSQSTVSVVLSGDRSIRISPETRRRVVEAVAALGYRHAAPRQLPHRPAQHRSEDEPPRRRGRSHTAWVMHEIGCRIVSGSYPEGALLPGDAGLMQEFGVSRTVLREAMKTLSGKGLLNAKTRIGTRVTARAEWHLFDPDVLVWHAEVGLDAAFLSALGEMRLVLEPEAAALAAARRSPEQLAALYAWVDRMSGAGNSRREFVDADLNFHLEVARTAGNPFLRAISTLIEVALVAALTRSSPVDEPRGVENSAAQHRAIADAIATGNPEKARAGMRLVIGEGIRRAGN